MDKLDGHFGNAAEGYPRRGEIIEIFVWIMLAFFVLSWARLCEAPSLSNDGYQYLSEAHHLLAEHSPSTSLIVFDVERAHGLIPAPMTTFPPGYPLAIAALANLGFSLESAARLISSIALSLTAGLFAAMLIGTGVASILRPLLMVFLIANATFVCYGAVLLSEPLFTLLLTCMVAGFVWIEYRLAAARSFTLLAVFANLAAALTCWVRYAGYFVLAALFLYVFIQWMRFRNRQRAILLAAALIPFFSAACLMLRNLTLSGTWKGGNDLEVHNRLAPLLLTCMVSHLHLFFGGHAVRFGLGEIVLLLGVLILAATSAVAFKRFLGAGAAQAGPLPLANSCLLTALCIAVYTLALLYAGVHTVVSFGERMFVPLIPLYCLLLAWAISALDRRLRPASSRASLWLTAGLALTAFGYIAVNARDFAMPRRPAPHQILAELYAMPMENGQTMIDWFHQTIPPGEAVLSEESQATGFLLERPTVGMTTSEYSATHWECGTIQPLMDRFHMRYIVLYRSVPAAQSKSQSAAIALLPESHFVADSLAGHPPCGFVVAAQNPQILVLRNLPRTN